MWHNNKMFMKKAIFIETEISYSVENMYIQMFYIHDLVVHVYTVY